LNPLITANIFHFFTSPNKTMETVTINPKPKPKQPTHKTTEVPESPETSETSETSESSETSETSRRISGERLPELPGLPFLSLEESDFFPPPNVFGEWKGLSHAMETAVEPEILPIDKVTLPTISSRLSPISEVKRVISPSPGQLRQEKMLEILDKIEIEKIEESISFPKGGYPLPMLKGFAKELGISTADLRKAGVAKRILEKIKLKVEFED